MTAVAFVVFAFNIVFIGFLVYFAKADGMKVKFTRLSEWKGVHKFFTVPVSLFCVLVLAGTFVMYTHSENEIDKMYADAGKTRPTAEQLEPRESTKFEPRECDSKPDPFGNVCKEAWE